MLTNGESYTIIIVSRLGENKIRRCYVSTSANIIIEDGHSRQMFYRHSDGYPEGVMDSINTFMRWLSEDKIRDNVSQAAGWLIIIGNQEYGYGLKPGGEHDDWKVGAYEPVNRFVDGIKFLYYIDLKKQSVSAYDIFSPDPDFVKAPKRIGYKEWDRDGKVIKSFGALKKL
jgi:hypothetical protein